MNGVVSQSAVLFGMHKSEMLIDDVTQIVQRVPFIECAPLHLFDPGLLAELADASDRLAATVAKLQEKANARHAA